jgi:hypothetical protein
VLLLMAAFGVCGLASTVHPAWISAPLWTAAAAMAMVGFVMTFRDYG